MFVATGSRTRFLERRMEQFYKDYIQPLTREAARLGLSVEVLAEMISRSSADPVLTERSSGR